MNRVVVVGISSSHPVVTEKLRVIRVDYKFDGVDRLNLQVSGKKKRIKGSQHQVGRHSLCKIECADGRDFVIETKSVPGTLIEVNQQLLDHPNWIVEDVR